VSSLRWFDAHTHWIQAGRGLVPIPPEKKPSTILGPGYTVGELWELAVRNVVERIREDQPDLFNDEGWEGLALGWTQFWKERHEAQFGNDARVRGWDEVMKDAP
jgi:hypothetical protein